MLHCRWLPAGHSDTATVFWREIEDEFTEMAYFFLDLTEQNRITASSQVNFVQSNANNKFN